MSTNSGEVQLHQPSLRQHRCLSVTDTGYREHYDDECTYHFASIADAVCKISARHWSVSQVAVLCPACTDVRTIGRQCFPMLPPTLQA